MLGWMLSLSASLRGRATPPEGVVRRFSNNGIERTHESYTQPVSARSPLMPNTLDRAQQGPRFGSLWEVQDV